MAYDDSPTRAQLAEKFSTFKPSTIVSSNPNQTFELALPGSAFPSIDRASAAQVLGSTQQPTTAPSSQFLDTLVRQLSVPVPEQEPGQPSIFNVPLVGPLFDILDTPRALAVSTISEIGDMFGSGDASLSDWWNQTMNNMSAGEVLRNWGVELPGPLDFAVGLGFDIALDPLTYVAGAGLALRAVRGAPEVATALTRVADAADAAGDTAKALRFRNAEEVVSTRGVLAGAGRHAEEYLEIGINPNLGFIVPGTGVIGRRIIARPLASISPRFAERLATAQLRQTPQLVADTVRRGKSGFDITNPNNQRLVLDRILNRRGGFSNLAQREVVGEVAAAVSKSAVKVDLPGAAGVRGAQALGFLAGSAGGAWNSIARRSFISNIGETFNSQYSINNGLKSSIPEVRRLARNILVYAQRANVTAGRWEKQTLDELAQVVRQANALGLSPQEFDELMFVVATTPQSQFTAAGLQRYAAAADGGNDDLHKLAMDAQGWWQSAGRRASEATPSIDINWAESLYAARMRDDLRSNPKSYIREEGINISPIDQLSGSPNVARRLLEPIIIKNRMLRSRSAPSRQGRPFREDVDRLDSQARRNVEARKDVDDAGTESVEARVRAEFEALLDAELAEGVRYVDGDSVMTNKYLDEPIQDSETAGKSVIEQMNDIDRKVGVPTEVRKGKPFSFSSDAQSVLPRYVALTKRNIRTRAVIDQAADDAVAVPGAKVAQGDAARQAIKAEEGLRLEQARLDQAIKELEDLGATPEQVSDVVEDMLLNRGIGPEQIREFVQTPEGELYGPIAQLEAELDTLHEVLNASVNGKFFGDLSDDARNLLLGGDDVEDWAALSQRKRDQIARNKANRDEALLAVQQATDYVYRITVVMGELEARRNALGGILKQMKNQNAEMPATTAQRLDRLARDLDQSRLMLDDLIQNIKRAYSTSDATVIAGLGLKQLSEPAAAAAARAELRSTARAMGRTAEGIRQLREMISFIPEDGEFVRFVRNGRTRSWEIRVRKQPLKDRKRAPRRDSLASLIGNERAEGLRKIAATLDNDPASLAQIKVLENYINITVLQEKLGKLIPGSETLDAIDSALGNAIAVREVIANAAHNQYWDGLQGALDDAVAAGRRSPTMQAVLDPLAERAATIERVIDETTERIEVIGFNVRDASARRELFETELIETTAEVQRLAESAWLPDRLRAASDAEAAAKIMVQGQNVNTFIDLMNQSLPEHIMGRMRSYSPDFFADDINGPKVGSLTQSKLRGTSFVAPLGMDLTDEQITRLAREYAEMFQAAARTADPQELKAFFRMMERFNNWWKAQAVGTPGFVMRNMMGAMWMNNQLAGVPFSTMGRVVLIRRKAAAAAKKGGQQGNIMYGLDQLIKEGGTTIRGGPFSGSSNVSRRELETFVDWYGSGIASGTGGRGIEIVTGVDSGGLVRETEGFRSGFEAGTWKPTADFKFFSAIRGWNADVEFMARGSLAHHTMMRNGTVEQASDLVTKYHFDYSDLTAAERSAKQVIPFWTWQRRVLPVLIESVGRNPKAWNRISQFQANIERQSPEEGLVPSYFGENLGVRLPFTSNGFRVYAMPDLPFTDLSDWAKSFDDEEFKDVTDLPMAVLRKPLESAIPSYKLPIELLMGTRTFNQVPLNDELEPAPNWARIPVITQALDFAGVLERNRSGDLFMTDTNAYKFEQFIPYFARMSRILPRTDPQWQSSDSAKQIASIFSNLFGLGIRINSPKEQRNEYLRQMYDQSAERTRQAMLAG